jgi:hypothetical protein
VGGGGGDGEIGQLRPQRCQLGDVNASAPSRAYEKASSDLPGGYFCAIHLFQAGGGADEDLRTVALWLQKILYGLGHHIPGMGTGDDQGLTFQVQAGAYLGQIL